MSENILEQLRSKKISWTVNKNGQIKYQSDGENCDKKAVKMVLSCLSDISLSDLEQLIRDEDDEFSEKENQTKYMKLPRRNALYMDDNLTALDHELFKNIKFEHLGDGSVVFAVKDSNEYETYTRVLASLDTAGSVEGLSKAFINNPQDNPHFKMKAILRGLDELYRTEKGVDVEQLAKVMPTCLYNIVNIKCEDDDGDTLWLSPSYDVFGEFLRYKQDFMFSKIHTLPTRLKNLTNDPKEPALAYCDLKKLHNEYYDKPSVLWDNFLLERFHSEAALSIFKAWCYSVFVGDNNSRQEMWLYGQGGTGKGCIQYAFVEGFKKLCGKNLVLAMSKDSGKGNFNSELLNKHLGIYADAKNLKQGMSEQHQNITGGDYQRIEGKGKDAISAGIYLKLLTFSNEKPQCSMTDRAQSSRFIILPFNLTDEEMQSLDLMDEYTQLIGSNTFKYELANEFPNFIASCEDHYKKRCPRGSNIDAHEFLSEIHTCELSENELADEFISKYFVINNADTDTYTVSKDLSLFINEWLSFEQRYGGISRDVTPTIIRDRLQRSYNVKKTSKRVDGKVLNVYVGLKCKSEDERRDLDEDLCF